MLPSTSLMSQAKFFKDYSRWNEDAQAYETWEQAVARVMAMHKKKYAHLLTPALEAEMAKAQKSYEAKSVLGAQRALQFGGEQLLRNEARMYNCASSWADRPEFFQEAMQLLLCGSGVGFSVQKRHVNKLPAIVRRSPKRTKTFQIPDSIEGWADAFGVLLSSFYEDRAPFPQYQGVQVHFDFSLIRPKGAYISGGFKAPGPEPLRQALALCEDLLARELQQAPRTALRPIVVYDFVMFMADAVLSGGVRRSATLCMFDKDDEEMLKAKTGDWWVTNPQRGRSNNSVILVRGELNREEWAGIMKNVKEFGEPGFIFTEDPDFTYNPLTTRAVMAANDECAQGERAAA